MESSREKSGFMLDGIAGPGLAVASVDVGRSAVKFRLKNLY